MVGPQRADGHERPPPPQQPLNCPRCDSLNTKFCYYNNYSLSQPRHFCKSCRRYWTQGGTLRNVPVGGGCRKKSRSKPATATAAAAGSSSSSSADTSHFSRHHHHMVQSSGPTTSPPVPPPPPHPPALGGMLPIHYHSGVGLLSSLTALQSSLGYHQDPLGGPPLMNRQSIGAGNPTGPNIGFLQGLGQVNPTLASLNNQAPQSQPTLSFLRDAYPTSASNASEAVEWGIGGPSSSTGTGGPTVNLNGRHPYSHLPGYGHPPRNY